MAHLLRTGHPCPTSPLPTSVCRARDRFRGGSQNVCCSQISALVRRPISKTSGECSGGLDGVTHAPTGGGDRNNLWVDVIRHSACWLGMILRSHDIAEQILSSTVATMSHLFFGRPLTATQSSTHSGLSENHHPVHPFKIRNFWEVPFMWEVRFMTFRHLTINFRIRNRHLPTNFVYSDRQCSWWSALNNALLWA